MLRTRMFEIHVRMNIIRVAKKLRTGKHVGTKKERSDCCFEL